MGGDPGLRRRQPQSGDRAGGTGDDSRQAGPAALAFGQCLDPDGNAVTVNWWRWDDADSFGGKIDLRHSGNGVRLTVPKDAKPGDTIQIVAEATDNGAPR